MTPEDVLRALGWALDHRLESDFDVELKRWQKESGIEMLGTESLEAQTLVELVRARLRDPRVIKDVIVGLGEISQEPE